MSLPWRGVVALCLAFPAGSPAVLAQGATAGPLIHVPVPPAPQRYAHRKKLRASYDTVADSTHLAVITHKGKYFLTVQRPRLTWSVEYAGRAPGPRPPAMVILEFRTQAPQVATNSLLVLNYGVGESFEVPSTGAFSDPGVQTWNHYMRFPLSCEVLAGALASDSMTVTVGGIVVRFKPDELNALRDLMARVGAWPPSPPRLGGA